MNPFYHGTRGPLRYFLQSPGVFPVHRRKARLKLEGSENLRSSMVVLVALFFSIIVKAVCARTAFGIAGGAPAGHR